MKKYSLEKAQEKANKMQSKVESSEAENYNEAEKLIKKEKVEDKAQKMINEEKCNGFVKNWENKFITTSGISYEELAEFAKKAHEIWNSKFTDDEKYFELKKQLAAEQAVSPRITEKHQELAMQIMQTTMGNLESTKKFIDYKLSESQKDIEAKKLREARTGIYGEPEDREIFDPEEELKNINKFTKEENEQMTLEEKMAVKKRRFEDYKQKLAEQKVAIAEINSELENKILNSKDISRDDLEVFILAQVKEHKLSKRQLDKYREIFDEGQKRNAIIKEFSRKFEGKDREFFEAMFGKKPFGKIKIEAGAVSFSVICEDAQDYAWIISAKYKYAESGSDLNENDLKDSQSTSGQVLLHGTKIRELRNYVTAINASFNRSKYDKPLRDTVIHEEKHEINNLINTVFSKEFRHGLKSNEEKAKDEILSFFKDGSDTELIKFYLTAKEDEGGHYDYLEKDKRHWQILYDGYINHPGYVDNSYMVAWAEELKKALENIENDEKTYYKHVGGALDNLNKLEKLGFSRSEIIGLFQTENLDKWGKVYERIKNSTDFQKKKSNFISNLDEEIRKTENSIDIFQDELKEIEQYKENQENLSRLSKFMRALFRKPEEVILARKDTEFAKRQILLGSERLQKLLEQKENMKRL